MRNYKIIIEYDGTDYNGWQVQSASKKLATIQGELEKVFQSILCEKVHITGSGRTDSGVHAEGQCASFKSNTKIPLKNILQAVNTYLPESIRVKEIKIVPDSFNARFSAKKKWYRYVIQNKKILSPIARYYSAYHPYELDVKLMKKAASIIKGRHDFSGVVLTEDENKVRTIYKLSVSKINDFIYIDIVGDGFLYKMVRRIVGVLLNAGRGKIDIRDVKELILKKKTNFDIQTAPANGLFLMKVYY
jgi:tRNA pseudouridine38-40 synthase